MIKLQLLHLFFLSDYKLKCFKTGRNIQVTNGFKLFKFSWFGEQMNIFMQQTDTWTSKIMERCPF